MMKVYTENTKNATKLPELINESNKFLGYKINMQITEDGGALWLIFQDSSLDVPLRAWLLVHRSPSDILTIQLND